MAGVQITVTTRGIRRNADLGKKQVLQAQDRIGRGLAGFRGTVDCSKGVEEKKGVRLGILHNIGITQIRIEGDSRPADDLAARELISALVGIVLTSEDLAAAIAARPALAGKVKLEGNFGVKAKKKEGKFGKGEQKGEPVRSAKSPQTASAGRVVPAELAAAVAPKSSVVAPEKSKLEIPPFKLSFGHKFGAGFMLLSLVSTVAVPACLWATAVITTVAPLLGIVGGGILLTLASRFITRMFIRDAQNNQEQKGIVSINSEVFPGDKETALRLELINLGLAKGMNVYKQYDYSSSRSYYAIGNVNEEEAVRLALVRIFGDTDFMFWREYDFFSKTVVFSRGERWTVRKFFPRQNVLILKAKVYGE
ncbi:MAG: hypothetical protein WCV91_00025 [Candidatus Margulisiibacteriota bacterium]